MQTISYMGKIIYHSDYKPLLKKRRVNVIPKYIEANARDYEIMFNLTRLKCKPKDKLIAMEIINGTIREL